MTIPTTPARPFREVTSGREVEELRELAEVARARSAELDIRAGSARIAGDAATSDAFADRSSFAWGVSRALAWLAGEEPGPMLAEVLGQ